MLWPQLFTAIQFQDYIILGACWILICLLLLSSNPMQLNAKSHVFLDLRGNLHHRPTLRPSRHRGWKVIRTQKLLFPLCFFMKIFSTRDSLLHPVRIHLCHNLVRKAPWNIPDMTRIIRRNRKISCFSRFIAPRCWRSGHSTNDPGRIQVIVPNLWVAVTVQCYVDARGNTSCLRSMRMFGTFYTPRPFCRPSSYGMIHSSQLGICEGEYEGMLVWITKPSVFWGMATKYVATNCLISKFWVCRFGHPGYHISRDASRKTDRQTDVSG